MWTMLTNENKAYEHAFTALELMAAAANIDMRHLHHRYRAGTAVKLLRAEAARLLRLARQWDRATACKVWSRHRPQITSR